jgi:hypothetical protein
MPKQAHRTRGELVENGRVAGDLHLITAIQSPLQIR